MKNFLNILAKILTILPPAVAVAQAGGELLKPGEKTGPQKAAAVQQVIMSSLEAAGLLGADLVVDQDRFNQGIQKLTDGAVDVMKSHRPKA